MPMANPSALPFWIKGSASRSISCLIVPPCCNRSIAGFGSCTTRDEKVVLHEVVKSATAGKSSQGPFIVIVTNAEPYGWYMILTNGTGKNNTAAYQF